MKHIQTKIFNLQCYETFLLDKLLVQSITFECLCLFLALETIISPKGPFNSCSKAFDNITQSPTSG